MSFEEKYPEIAQALDGLGDKSKITRKKSLVQVIMFVVVRMQRKKKNGGVDSYK